MTARRAGALRRAACDAASAGTPVLLAIHLGVSSSTGDKVLMRAGDPIYEIGPALGGHRREDRFCRQTLTALAAAFDHGGAA